MVYHGLRIFHIAYTYCMFAYLHIRILHRPHITYCTSHIYVMLHIFICVRIIAYCTLHIAFYTWYITRVCVILHTYDIFILHKYDILPDILHTYDILPDILHGHNLPRHSQLSPLAPLPPTYFSSPVSYLLLLPCLILPTYHSVLRHTQLLLLLLLLLLPCLLLKNRGSTAWATIFRYTHTHTHTHTHAHTHTHTHMHTHTRTHAHAHTYIYVILTMCAFMYTYIYIYTYIHIHIYTHSM